MKGRGAARLFPRALTPVYLERVNRPVGVNGRAFYGRVSIAGLRLMSPFSFTGVESKLTTNPDPERLAVQLDLLNIEWERRGFYI